MLPPIDPKQQERVCNATESCLAHASRIYKRSFALIPVRFDLRGRAAGMYRVHGNERCIRYNPWLFGKYFEDSLAVTVPHEVAHYVTDLLYGLRNIKPHGPEWQAVMRSLGAEPRASARYDLAGVPVRRQRRFHYHCGCSSHRLSSIRHNRIQHDQAAYFCRRCGDRLRSSGDSSRAGHVADIPAQEPA